MIGVASVLLLTSCGASNTDEAVPPADSFPTTASPTTTAVTSSASGSQVVPFGQPLIGASGAQITVDSVEDIGGVTVIGILYTAGDSTIEGYNLLTPDLTYGPKGLDAEWNTTSSSDTFGGVIPPGTAKLLDWAYDVPLSELNPATLTVGIGLASPAWTGDLSTFDPASPAGIPSTTPSSVEGTVTGEQPTGEPLVDQMSAVFGVALSPVEAGQIAGDICSQFSNLGSSREEVVANVVRTEGVADGFAEQIVGVAVSYSCPQFGGR